jgi:membrane fusion protein, multidrug efflux system
LLGQACAFALGASGYGFYWWTIDRLFQNTDDAYVGGDVTPISPHVAGFIAEIPVTDNQRVQAGQLLVRLDDRDVRAAADHAAAILEQRKATLASLRAKYELQQSAIQQAAADLDAKTAQADFAKSDAQRTEPLSEFRFPAGCRKNVRARSDGEGGRYIGTSRARCRKTATERSERRHDPGKLCPLCVDGRVILLDEF